MLPPTHKTFRFSQLFPQLLLPSAAVEAMPTQPAGGAAQQGLQSEPAGTGDSAPTGGFEPGWVNAHPLETAVTHPGSAPDTAPSQAVVLGEGRFM